MKLSFLQRLFSQIVPVRIHSFPGTTSPELKLYRYRGRWQLEAESALYSDGAAYTPLALSFKHLRSEINGARNMLVLGAGLGSALSVLEHLQLKVPQTTMVDIDPEVVILGAKLTPHEHAQWICDDVKNFVEQDLNLYDVIVLDVFQDRVVPQFVCSEPFLKRCASLLSPQGVLVFNYIINNESDWHRLQDILSGSFETLRIIPIRINRILLLKKTPDQP